MIKNGNVPTVIIPGEVYAGAQRFIGRIPKSLIGALTIGDEVLISDYGLEAFPATVAEIKRSGTKALFERRGPVPSRRKVVFPAEMINMLEKNNISQAAKT